MNVDSISAPPQAGARTGSGAAPASDYQMFLKMLTAQIRNQDPLNPIESSDYAVQLATFSGVEQQVRTNELLEALAGGLGADGMARYADWVGAEVLAPAPVRFDGTPVTLYPEPADGAERTFLVAHDANGREVLRQEVPVSAEPVTWTGTGPADGQVLPGTYRFTLESLIGDQPPQVSDVSHFARVDEVRQSAGGPKLLLAGSGEVAPSLVRALRRPAP